MKHTSHRDVDRRLARIAGHLEGVRRMIAEEKSCIEVLQQMKAIMSALESARNVLLKDHVQHCLGDAIQKRNTEAAVKEIEGILSQIL
jgi:DNA-binding FrmR family transcriptional regulator